MPVRTKRRRILVIEDDPMNTLLACDMLEYLGYEVLKVDNAEEGIELAKSASPDLILTDIRLPGMSGLEAVKTLRADPKTKEIPIVVWTAFVREEDRVRSFAAGCDGHIPKPIGMAEFMAAIQRYVERRKTA